MKYKRYARDQFSLKSHFFKEEKTQPAAIYSKGVKLTHIKGQKPTYSLELIKYHIVFSCITGST